jgi:hypothetical protein
MPYVVQDEYYAVRRAQSLPPLRQHNLINPLAGFGIFGVVKEVGIDA